MKLKFDPSLEYQQNAVNAVIDVFSGQPPAQSNFEISAAAGSGMLLTELGVGNCITLNDEQLLKNVKKIQGKNNIDETSVLQGRNFSVEMETGTGKTYVYLRSIFELSKKYGLKKFIIVVPSVAIREGVLKSIEIMKDHFLTLYDNVPFDYFVYDSKKLGRVRQFATSNQLQIMVINIQSFSKDVADKDIGKMTDDELKKLNIINRENDRMSGRKPIEFIQSVNPIVIIDEPQSVDNTLKAKCAVENLNPITTLRYSATHRNPYNLLYKLDPVRAYDLRLVKRIEVASIRANENFNEAYVKLLKIDNKKGIKAQVEIHQKKGDSVKPAKMWVKQGDDLYVKSGKREIYCDGYIVQNIDCTPGTEYIEFNSGKFLELGQGIGDLGDDIMKAQVQETVEQHLKKERVLRNKGIKVLSLFFIDKVANYRIYNEDKTTSLGKIGQWFEEAYKKLTAKLYEDFAPKALGHDIDKIHNGYFSQDKAGQWKDSTERGSKHDDDTYHLIMRHKEQLLNPKEPLRFIFSHSALREGWDNPNVFQICTLNETASVEKKRQEIGRGLRLPVNEHGDRIHDENINRLTIIASESYEDFAKSLQNEFEEDLGIKFGCIEKIAFSKITRINENGGEEAIGQDESTKIWSKLEQSGYISKSGEIQGKFDPKNPHFELKISEKYNDIKNAIINKMNDFIYINRVVNARDRRTLKFSKEVYLSAEFKALWDKIKQRTRFRVAFDTEELIECAAKYIKNLDEIKQARIAMTKADIGISDTGVSTDREQEGGRYDISEVIVLPDLLAYLQEETELTRQTLVDILKRTERLAEFKINPQRFMTLTASKISEALHDLIIKGIQYEKIADSSWEMNRINDEANNGIVRYLDNLYEVQNQEKSLFDTIEFDSKVEKEFAENLDNNEYVRLFVKLPSWFKIDTPIGSYNPDWAFVTHRNERLYFVRETKSTLDDKELSIYEKQKTSCGKRHFETIDVDYKVVTKLADVDF